MDDTTTGQGLATNEQPNEPQDASAQDAGTISGTVEVDTTIELTGNLVGTPPAAAAAPPPNSPYPTPVPTPAPVSAEQQARDTTPTREEAREMFKANPGLWAVLTDTGNMTRDEC